MDLNVVHNKDVREFLSSIDDRSVMLCWTDPPFGTGKTYELSGYSYYDPPAPKVLSMLKDIGSEFRRILHIRGTLVVQLDHTLIHDVIVAYKSMGLKFQGEIIHHSEQGGVSRKWWTNKHTTLAMFSKGRNPKFYLDRVPLIPRKNGPAQRGGVNYGATRRVNSVWNYTGVGRGQRIGYPSQKPVAIVKPFVKVHTDVKDLVIDPFCGSGTLGEVAVMGGRNFLLNDLNSEACVVAKERIANAKRDEKFDVARLTNLDAS